MEKIRTEKVCSVKGCGRPPRARGLCQTHYKHMRRDGRTRPIRSVRRPRRRTVRFAGLSLTPRTARILSREARARQIAPNALITDIIEAWSRRRNRPTQLALFPELTLVPPGRG